MPREYMGAGHLAATGVQGGSYQPQHQNHFLFEVSLDTFGLDGSILTLAIDNAFAPSISNDEIELVFLNERRYVAGQATFDAGNIVVRDFCDVEVGKLLASWRNRVYDPVTGKVGWATDYKQACDLVMLGPDGSGDRIWKIIGAWPQQVNFGTFDYNGSDQVKMETTLRYDLAFPERLSNINKLGPNPIVP